MKGSNQVQHKSDVGNQIILVIDGRPVRKFYTSIFFQRLGYHVITSTTAEDGLTFMSMTVPLVIIANIDLPDMTGLDLLKLIKKKQRTCKIPVIIYTSNKNPKIQQECEKSGCAAYLRHPATLEELYAAVQMATNKPRRFVRLETFLDVEIGDGIPSAERQPDYIAAISELGMFVSTSNQLSYGSVHPFTFHLPNAPGWTIKVEGQVVYRQQIDNTRKQPGIGVKFLTIGLPEREFIKTFIREKLMEGISPI